jgi:DHA1 family bicyclomycin/chloramphenicol resistance-like MFS transporter
VLSIIYAYLVLFNVLGPFLIQVVLHQSAIVFGQIALCLGIAWFLGTLANRFLAGSFPKLPLMEIGSAVTLCGSLLMGWFAIWEGVSVPHLVIPTAVIFLVARLRSHNVSEGACSSFPDWQARPVL